MAGMTPTQVEQIVNQQTAPDQPSDPTIPDLPPDWNPTPQTQQQPSDGVPYYLQRPDDNPYGNSLDILDPTGRYVTHFYPPTKYHGAYGYVEDKATGGTRPMTAEEIGAFSGAAGGGGTGADHYATDSAARNAQNQLAYNYAQLAQQKQLQEEQLAEQQRQFGITNPEEEQARQQGFLQNRATTGLDLGKFQQSLANDAYKRAADPGNFPAYLAASAGLPRSGSPIDQLLGNGTQIAQPEGSNPYSDPRFQDLMNELYGYAKPTSLSVVQNLAAQNGGQLPQSFYDYTGTQAPSYAQGGSQMLHEPVIGIGLHSGQPQFLAGEAGDEKLTFTPSVHSHSDGGMPIPHSHDRGDQKHEHMDANSPATYADGGTAQIQPYDSAQDPMQGKYGSQPNTPSTTVPNTLGSSAASPAAPAPSDGTGTYSYDQPDPNLQRVRDAYAQNPEAANRFFSQSPENLTRMFGPQSNPQDFFNKWGSYTPDQQNRLRGIAANGGLTPAQGTSIALGKGLQQLGWVPQVLVQTLLQGDAPTPGMVDDQTLMRLPPSYRALLQAAIRARVGSAGLGDYAQSQQEYSMPGLGSSYPTASYG